MRLHRTAKLKKCKKIPKLCISRRPKTHRGVIYTRIIVDNIIIVVVFLYNISYIVVLNTVRIPPTRRAGVPRRYARASRRSSLRTYRDDRRGNVATKPARRSCAARFNVVGNGGIIAAAHRARACACGGPAVAACNAAALNCVSGAPVCTGRPRDSGRRRRRRCAGVLQGHASSSGACACRRGVRKGRLPEGKCPPPLYRPKRKKRASLLPQTCTK